ncbi:MAG TPA: HEAT repeat domain-containing protein, partial [Nannocystis exedens]|nr:HEAT repeat domain-containing protein [Nannocystis exedens]
MPSAPTANSQTAAKGRARRPLSEALHDPGFTPRRRDLASLIELLAVGEARQARLVEAAILRIGPVVGDALEQAFAVAKPPLRGRLVRILGRWALTCPERIDGVLRALGDADAKTQRNAIIAAGKLDDPRVLGRILQLARVEDRLPHLRSLTDALGKVGGVQALEWLRGLDDRGDPELVRLRTKALLIAERTLARTLDSAGQVDLQAQVERPIAVEFRCRAGLEELLIDEMLALGSLQLQLKNPRVIAQGVVGVRFAGPLGDLFKIRLALEVGFPLSGSGTLPRRGDEVSAVVDRLAQPALREHLRRWTRGAIRYRLDLVGGHRRAEVWRIAEQLRRVAPELINDPTASTWEIRTRRVDRELV